MQSMSSSSWLMRIKIMNLCIVWLLLLSRLGKTSFLSDRKVDLGKLLFWATEINGWWEKLSWHRTLIHCYFWSIFTLGYMWTFTQRCYNVRKWTLLCIRLGNVCKTLSKNFKILYYQNVDKTLHIRLKI